MARASPLFVRYLFSYLVLVLLPLAVFSVFLFRYVSDLLVTDAIALTTARLEVLQSAVDREVLAMADTAVKIGSSQPLRPFRLAQSPANAYFAVRALDGFRLPTGVVDEVFLRYDADDYLLCSSTTVAVARADVIAGGTSETEATEFVDRILGPTREAGVSGPYQVGLFGASPRPYLLVQFPVPSWEAHPYGTLTFVLSIEKLFGWAPKDTEGVLYVIETPEGLHVTPDGLRTSDWELEGDLAERQAAPGRAARNQGRRRIVAPALSSSTQWRVYSLVDTQAIARPAANLQRLTLAVMLATATGAALVIRFFVRVNYRPVQRLLDTLSASRPRGHPIDTVRAAHESLTGLILHERHLESELQRREETVREGVVAHLLSGASTAHLDIEDLWIGDAVDGGKCRFNVLAIRPPDACPNGEALLGDLKQFANEETYPPGQWLFRPGVGREPTVAVLRISYSLGDGVFRDFGRRMLRRLGETWDHGGVVAIGRTVETIDEIMKSHDAALRALDQHFVLGVDRLILDATHEPTQWSRIPLVVEAAPFRQSVMSGSTAAAARYLEEIGVRLREVSAPAHVARGLCFEICRIVADLATELSRDLEVGNPPCTIGLESYPTYGAFETAVLGFLRDLGAIHSGRRDREMLRLVAELRREIDERFADPQLSIQALAARFGISPSTVSTLFRRYDGRGANEYLAEKRIEEAMRLLRDTDLPLKDLAGRVGYYNVSSFIRRFRTETGLTPGEYRTTGV